MRDRDKILINEFSSALKKNANGGIINLDDKFEQKFDFFVGRYETIKERTGNIIHPHKWSYHRIGLITDGNVDYICGMYKFKAVKNTLLILPSRITTQSVWSDDAKGLTTVFNIDFFLQNQFHPTLVENKAILQLTVQPYIHLSNEQADEVQSIFNVILKEQDEEEPNKHQFIALKVLELILIAERLYSEARLITDNSKTLDVVKRFADLLEQNFTTEHSVLFYANQLYIHPNHLNALIKSQTGLSPKGSIQTRIVLEAKFLLHSTDLSIKEIANQLGFTDPNYFIVFFKRLEHTSPAVYRQSFV